MDLGPAYVHNAGSPEDDADEEVVEVSDFIVSIPEIEAYGGLDGIAALNGESGSGAQGGGMIIEDLNTERPILKLGPCIFYGQHQFTLGSTVVFDTAPGAGLAAAKEEMKRQPDKATASLVASAAAVEVPPIVSIARRAIVFRLAPGSPGIKELFRKDSAHHAGAASSSSSSSSSAGGAGGGNA
jgi:TFIIIC subunit triple barrel domain